MVVQPEMSKKYNIMDVFLMLAWSASIHNTNAAVRNTGWTIFDKCDQEAQQAIRTIVIDSQEPLQNVFSALARYQGNPDNIAYYTEQLASGAMLPIYAIH